MDNNHQRQHTKHPTPSVCSLLSKAHILSGLQPRTAFPQSRTKESSVPCVQNRKKHKEMV